MSARPARLTAAARRLRVRIAGGAIGLALCGAALAASPPPLLMNLDAFDRAKQTARLGNGMALAYVDLGPRSGPPVVLIHGYTDNARDWVPLIPYLDKAFRLIVVDIRGHGRSTKPECCYTRVDFAYDIRLLLDRLHIRQADVIGHSLGSIITQTFAEYWPERTRRVVLVSSTGGTLARCTPAATEPGPPKMDFRSEIVKLKEPIDPDSKFMVEWWDSPTPVDPDFIRRQRRDAAAIPLRVWLAVLDQGLAGMDLQSTLPRLKAPALLLWGDQDPIFGPSDRCSLQAGLPGAQVHVFAGLGHNPFWENPQAVADVINPFLRSSP